MWALLVCASQRICPFYLHQQIYGHKVVHYSSVRLFFKLFFRIDCMLTRVCRLPPRPPLNLKAFLRGEETWGRHAFRLYRPSTSSRLITLKSTPWTLTWLRLFQSIQWGPQRRASNWMWTPPRSVVPRALFCHTGSIGPLAIHGHFTQRCFTYHFSITATWQSQGLCLSSPKRQLFTFLCLDFRLIWAPVTNSVIGSEQVLTLLLSSLFSLSECEQSSL